MTQQDTLLENALCIFEEMIGKDEVQHRIREIDRNNQNITFEQAFNTRLPQKPVERFGWYLYTTEQYLRHPGNYDVNSGARIIPSMIAVGSRARNIKAIQNVKSKFEIAAKGSQDIESALFEILVGSAYIQDG